jgi:putative oxidoreductase
MRQMDIVNFSKNIGLLGSSLMFLAIPRPWPYSVERRVRIPVRATV